MKKITLFGLFILVLIQGYSQVDLNLGLAAYFRFNGNFDDLSSYNIDGVNSGASFNTGVDALSNGAIYCSATDLDFVNCGADNRGITNKVTISAWIRTSNSTSLQYVATKYDYTVDGGFVLGVNNGKAFVASRDGNNLYKASGLSTTNVSDGNWHFILGTIEANSLKIYVDCNLENTGTYSSTLSNLATSTPMSVGNLYNGDASSNFYHFTGDIDEFRLYNRILNSSEMNYICNVSTLSDDAIVTSPEIKIGPNPSHNVINVLNPPKDNYSVVIYDLTGKIVIQQAQSSSIDISSLNQGMYILCMKNVEGKELFREKVIKQ